MSVRIVQMQWVVEDAKLLLGAAPDLRQPILHKILSAVLASLICLPLFLI